ncbi:amino acid transporter, partial [Streptomyces sp. SID8499]|nr:amino acid transporter [Streptomyces sp. SID8499]
HSAGQGYGRPVEHPTGRPAAQPGAQPTGRAPEWR